MMTLQGPNALSLGVDIIDRIMTFCPDFRTLQAVALVSKEFQDVYQNHPKSITRAVAYNSVGPALPVALRVVRYPTSGVDPDLDPLTVAHECPEDHMASVITAVEQCELLKNAAVVAALEDVFSLQYKSRHSRTSVLTAVESERFRRAAYRAMLYSKLFPAHMYEADEVDDTDPVQIAKIQEQRAAVLGVYETQELLEMYSFVRFMARIHEEVSDGDPYVNIFLTTGPEGALTNWENQDSENVKEDLGYYLFDDDVPPFFAGYYERAFAKVWERRKHDPLFAQPKQKAPLFIPDVDEEEDGQDGDKAGEKEEEKEPKPLQLPTENDGGSPSRWLLDEVLGANDTCSHCPTSGGLDLLTEANWHTRFSHLTAVDYLNGLLNRNSTVTQPLSNTVSDAVAAARNAHPHDHEPRGTRVGLDEAAWIGKVFDVAEEMYAGSGTASTSEFASWSRHDSFCEPCLRRFLQEHVWRWALAERVKAGWVPPEDCWYGYNCRTQAHKPQHAINKNHLAVPTK